MNQPNLEGLVDALDNLNQAQLLTANNVETLMNQPNLEGLVDALDNFNQAQLLTQDVFNQLMRLAQGAEPERALEEYLDRLFGDAQNTHTASVHQSVSESVKQLAVRYKTKITGATLDETINEVKKYILGLDESSKEQAVKHRIGAAKRCIERITATDYTFTDPGSQCSIKQLLALSFSAIHDDACRIGNLEDAQIQFIEGLYEIQRGYNLNENGNDPQLSDPDKPICTAGTFNKLVEKLQGIHPDAKIHFITAETAALKLPKVVIEEANNYLSGLAKSEKTAQDFVSFIHLLDNIKKEGIELIFNAVKNKIAKRIGNEFKTVYPDKSAPGFIKFIETGIYTDLNKLKDLQPSLTNSAAYHGFFSKIIHSYKLFSNVKTQVQTTEQEHNPLVKRH
jgi:hypothetical protein